MITTILFRDCLRDTGGTQRLLLEEALYLKKIGFNPIIVTFSLDSSFLSFRSKRYKDIQIKVVKNKAYKLNFFTNLSKILNLRKTLKHISPNIIISQDTEGAVFLFFATVFTPLKYACHIHETIFWGLGYFYIYALIYRKAFNLVRNSHLGHMEFIPTKIPRRLNIYQQIANNLFAFISYFSVRKSERIFVLSGRMAWEVRAIYDREAVVARGAFPSSIFSYKQQKDIKHYLGLDNKRIILNINRLDVKKRIDLLLKAFSKITCKFDDLFLVIGGVGPDELRLKTIAKELRLNNVFFIGYIEEQDIWDYYVSCDLFVHPERIDYSIAVLEALALGRKVVCSDNIELNTEIIHNTNIFPAKLNIEDLTKAMEEALVSEVRPINKDRLMEFCWDNYFSIICNNFKDYIE